MRTISATLLLLMGSSAMAQLPALGSLAPTREELAPAQNAGDQAIKPKTRLRVEDEIERAPCPLSDAAYANVKVTFASVDFRNLQGVSADSLKETWAEFAGHEVPVATLCEVRDRAATILRRQGFVAAVQVPPQRIEKDGVVRFDVLLAKLVGIRVLGKAGKSERLIAAHLNKLVGKAYFNSFDAERHLLLAGDLPGYDVRLVLRPAGRGAGEVIGDVDVKRRRVEIAGAAQNMGSKAIGPFGGLLQVKVNDLLGLGDSSRVSLFNTADTREQTVLQLGETVTLGTSGLTLDGSFVYAWTRPDVANRSFFAHTLTATTELSYPIIRKRQMTLRGVGGLDWVDQSLDFGPARLSNDRLRVLFLRAELDAMDLSSVSGAYGYSAQEPHWGLSARGELRRGLLGFGASPYCLETPAACTAPNVPTSRPDADPQAVVARAQASFEYRPSPVVTLSFAPRGQISNGVLLGYEQFSAGNYTVGRGYDPGIIQGDDGVGAAFELRLNQLSPSSPRDLALQPYVFYDAAWTWTKGVTSGPTHYDLHSAGAGVRGQWGNHGRADLMLAVPLGRAGLQTQRGDMRLILSISTQLYPW